MGFSSPEFEIIGKKDIEDTHELLKLKNAKGILALVLASKEANSGAFFGGHNWEVIGQHPTIIEDFYGRINSKREFIAISEKIRTDLQGLIESGKI